MNTPSLKTLYKERIVSSLMKKFGFSNVSEVPHLVMAVINVGTSQALKDPKYLDTITTTLSRITGQKPVACVAKKSIAAFKIRQGQIIGQKVTLRGKRMYDFVEKIISIALPRIRDFRGLSPSSLDWQGNLSLGITEHIVFPEIKPDEIERVHGVEVTIVTRAKTREQSFELLKLLGFPFQTE